MFDLYLSKLFFFCLEIEQDPTFATGNKRGVYDESSDRKIRQAVIDKLLVWSDYDHLSFYCCFVFLRYFGVRGGEEVTMLNWDQVTFMQFDDGPYKGMNYVELLILEDKGMCCL